MGIKHPVETGIRLGTQLSSAIPPYEEREAARFSLYNWTAWQELSSGEKAMAVAHYRLHHMIDTHQQDALNDEMTRRSKRR